MTCLFVSHRESRQDLQQDPGEILAAEIFASRRESQLDSAGIPVERKKSRRPKSRRDLSGIPVKFVAGSRQDPGPYFTREVLFREQDMRFSQTILKLINYS